MRQIFHNILHFHWLATFMLMGLFSLFGAMASVNLFFLFTANFRLLHEHGFMAVMEGALFQTCELLLTGMFALAMYLGFKVCERVLVEKMLAR